jgi:hypothetical protein
MASGDTLHFDCIFWVAPNPSIEGSLYKEYKGDRSIEDLTKYVEGGYKTASDVPAPGTAATSDDVVGEIFTVLDVFLSSINPQKVMKQYLYATIAVSLLTGVMIGTILVSCCTSTHTKKE